MALVRNGGSAVSRRAYLDEAVFAEEAKKIFGKTWQFVAHESEIASPGDYVTRRLGTDPVIVSRSEAGEVHVLHNACRHRGAQLCAADIGNTSHFRCSYHGWTYQNTGKLRGVPHAPVLYKDPGVFNRGELGLRAARVDILHGLVFANWDQDAEPLRQSLGDMVWYLDTYFARDLEVIGSPTRLLGKHNWKSGAENWTADGYHAKVSHKVFFDLDIAKPGQPIVDQAVADGGGVPQADATMGDLAVAEYTAGRGHSGVAFRIPVAFDQPVFLGYESHLWDDFARPLTPEQRRMASTRVASVATVFPNFSFTELCLVNMGRDVGHQATLNIRVWSPLSATETEIWNWVLVPRNASDGWKKGSQKAFARTLGAGGMLEVDDLQNWTGIAEANLGVIGMDTDQNFVGHATDPSPAAEWPGKVYPGEYHDVMFREYFSEWARWMGEVSWEGEAAVSLDSELGGIDADPTPTI